MTHVPFEQIVAYFAGELPADEERAVEDHYFGCAACSATVEDVQTLTGAVATVIPPAVTSERLAELARGVARFRTTDVAPGQDVDVVFDREVDYLLHRLHADVAGAGRVDMEIFEGAEVLVRFEAVPIDAEAGVVQVVCQRHFGEMGFSDDVRFRLVAVAPDSRAVLGEYLVRHRFL